jgi:hypothetical protein
MKRIKSRAKIQQSDPLAITVADLLTDIPGVSSQPLRDTTNTPVLITNRATNQPTYGPHVPVLVEIAGGGGSGEEIELLKEILTSTNTNGNILNTVARGTDMIDSVVANGDRTYVQLQAIAVSVQNIASVIGELNDGIRDLVSQSATIITNTANTASRLTTVASNTGETSSSLLAAANGDAPLWVNRDKIKVNMLISGNSTEGITVAPPQYSINPLYVCPTAADRGTPTTYREWYGTQATCSAWNLGVDGRQSEITTSRLMCGPGTYERHTDANNLPTNTLIRADSVVSVENKLFGNTDNKVPLVVSSTLDTDNDSEFEVLTCVSSRDDVKSGPYTKL